LNVLLFFYIILLHFRDFLDLLEYLEEMGFLELPVEKVRTSFVSYNYKVFSETFQLAY